MLPSILKSAVQSTNTLIFVPSSFDFIRVENHLRKSDVSFATLSECVFQFKALRLAVCSNAGTGIPPIRTSREHVRRSSWARSPSFSPASDSISSGGTHNPTHHVSSSRINTSAHRYKLRGVRNLVFYGLPDHAQFYPEFLSFPFLDEGVEASDVTCRALFCKYDWLKLERIAGTDGALDMMKQM